MNDITIQKIIIGIAFSPIIWILFGILRSSAKPTQNIVLGVTLPYPHLRDESVLSIAKTFRKQLLVITLICFFCLASVFMINTPLGLYAATVLWVMVSAVIICLPYIKGNLAMGRLKAQSGWNLANAGTLLVDTKVSTNKRKGAVDIKLFAIPFLLSLITLVIDFVFKKNNLFVALSPLLSTLIMFQVYLLFRHSRSRTPSGTAEIDMQVNEHFQGLWSRFAFNASISNLIMLVFTYLSYSDLIPNNKFIVTLVVLSASFYLVYNLIRTILKVRNNEKNILAKSVVPDYIDNDRHWLLGLFYYNPNDNKIFMASRMGLNIGLNFAKPFSKVMIVFVVLLFLVHLALLVCELL